MRFRVLICLLLCVALGGTGCSAYELVRYVLFPDVPKFEAGEVREIPGLREPVAVALRGDGLWRIEARNEHDAILAAGVGPDGVAGAQGTLAFDRTRWNVMYGSSRFFDGLAGHLVNDEIEVRLRLVLAAAD